MNVNADSADYELAVLHCELSQLNNIGSYSYRLQGFIQDFQFEGETLCTSTKCGIGGMHSSPRFNFGLTIDFSISILKHLESQFPTPLNPGL